MARVCITTPSTRTPSSSTNKVIQREPADSAAPKLLGQLAAIGIVKGQTLRTRCADEPAPRMSPFGKVGQLASTAAVGPEAAPATALCEQGTLLDTNDLEVDLIVID